jgi:hypothetical protein
LNCTVLIEFYSIIAVCTLSYFRHTARRNAEKDEKIQVNILLHCAGPKVIEIYDQFTWANAENTFLN